MHYSHCIACGERYGRDRASVFALRPNYCSRMCRNRHTLADRFWANAEKGPDCWTWGGYRMSNGYGVSAAEGRGVLAHRLAYQLAFGAIPDGFHVCHRCDNPPCVRPDHLFLGTNQDNALDMVAKGRMPKTAMSGELNGYARLTMTDAQEIRSLYAAGGVTMKALGARFGVGYTTVNAVVHGRRWVE